MILIQFFPLLLDLRENKNKTAWVSPRDKSVKNISEFKEMCGASIRMTSLNTMRPRLRSSMYPR
mgnify:CR=1 FL=1